MKIEVLYTKPDEDVRVMWNPPTRFPTDEEIAGNYVVVYRDETERDYIVTPDNLFMVFNGAAPSTPNPLACPEKQAMLGSLGVRHTSMSVGDIVRIDDESYLCAPAGWIRKGVEG